MNIMHSGKKTHAVHVGQYMAEVPINYEYLGEEWDYAIGPDDVAKIERVRAALKIGNLATAAKEAKIFELHPVAAE